MDEQSLHILVVEDNPTDVFLLKKALKEVQSFEIILTQAKRLDEALQHLAEQDFDIVLLDLGLPDSQGLETFNRLQHDHSELPILILSGLEDEKLAVQAVQDGAQDFLVKGKINSTMLSRSIRYAIERKLSERRLIASEASYRRLFETAHDGIFILDAASGQITDANPHLVEMLGYDFSEFLGKRLWEIAPFRHKTANQAAFDTLHKKGFIHYDDLPLMTKDARQANVEFMSDFYTVGSQQVIQCNIRDISERKEAAAAEQESKRFLQSTLDALSSHIAVLNESGQIIAVNKAWKKFFEDNGGTPISCGVGASYLAVCDSASGAWSEEAPTIAQGIREVMVGQREEFCVEYPCHSPNEERWFNVCVTRLAGEGPLRVAVAHENITERKQAENLIIISEASLAKSQQMAHLGSWELDLSNLDDINANPLRWSDELYRIFGYEPGQIEVSNEAFFRAVHPNDRQRINSVMEEALSGGKPYSIEHRIILQDGRERIVHAQAEIIYNEQTGQPLKAVGLVQDITERKVAETERDRFFTISLDMLAIIGSDGYMKRLNPAFEATLGFSNAELMAVPFMEWVHPDDHAITAQAAARLKSGLAVTDFENRYCCRDGSYKWLRWTVAPHENLWYCVAHDITTIREAEAALHKANDELELHVGERTSELNLANEQLQKEMIERRRADEALYQNHEFLKAVLENTAEGIVACDHEGQLTFFNRATRDFHGLPMEPLPAEHWADYYSLYMPDGVTPMQLENVPLFQALSGEHLRDVEMVIAPKGGSPRLVLNNGEPLFDANGGKMGAVVVMHDITERKQVEMELQRAKQEADAANLAKSEFLSRMSHELRTPLNAILGFGQILATQENSPLVKESVGYILTGGRHLLDLINEVLDIARVEAGHVDLSLEPVALDDIVPEACALMSTLAAQRHIHIDQITAELNRNHVLADRQRLKQVLINLLANAIKYNHEGGEVEVSCSQNSDGWTSIAVRDTGPGISPRDLLKLFTPFERLSASTSEIEGTGLGLVLSQRLVTAMGGKLSVESTLGLGSSFSIELPQAAPQEDQVTDMPIKPPFVSATPKTQRATSALCIEDNPSNLRLMETIFAMRPEITLLTATQGGVGLDLARQHEPDLIFLDLNLPDIQGSEVLTRLQQSALTRDIPVVVLSADATPNQVEQQLSAGAKDYLTKPLDVGQLLDVLDKFLQTPEEIAAQLSASV